MIPAGRIPWQYSQLTYEARQAEGGLKRTLDDLKLLGTTPELFSAFKKAIDGIELSEDAADRRQITDEIKSAFSRPDRGALLNGFVNGLAPAANEALDRWFSTYLRSIEPSEILQHLSLGLALAEWESEACNFGDKAAAVERVLSWMKSRGDDDMILDLSGLALNVLPPLPNELRKLNIGGNTLKTLPPMPSSLQHLSAKNCFKLESLTGLSTTNLQSIDLGDGGTLPNNLWCDLPATTKGVYSRATSPHEFASEVRPYELVSRSEYIASPSKPITEYEAAVKIKRLLKSQERFGISKEDRAYILEHMANLRKAIVFSTTAAYANFSLVGKDDAVEIPPVPSDWNSVECLERGLANCGEQARMLLMLLREDSRISTGIKNDLHMTILGDGDHAFLTIGDDVGAGGKDTSVVIDPWSYYIVTRDSSSGKRILESQPSEKKGGFFGPMKEYKAFLKKNQPAFGLTDLEPTFITGVEVLNQKKEGPITHIVKAAADGAYDDLRRKLYE